MCKTYVGRESEIARIQTFPDWWEFSSGEKGRLSENSQLDEIYKQIGNAVPVLLARAIAKPIAEWAVEYVKKIILKVKSDCN